MVPAFRVGLGPFIGNPFTGYIMVLKTVGRKTGKTRYAPMNYAIMDGQVYCHQGGHLKGVWYLNLKANPKVEVLLPSGTLAGFGEAVTDPDESLRAIRNILKSSGFGFYVYGFNPFTASDKVVREKTKDVSVVRITPVGIGSGAADFGGGLWMLVFGFLAVVLVLIFLSVFVVDLTSSI